MWKSNKEKLIGFCKYNYEGVIKLNQILVKKESITFRRRDPGLQAYCPECNWEGNCLLLKQELQKWNVKQKPKIS
jgi:hypothetical protein